MRSSFFLFPLALMDLIVFGRFINVKELHSLQEIANPLIYSSWLGISFSHKQLWLDSVNEGLVNYGVWLHA